MHQNYFGTDENAGPLAVSLVKDKMEPSPTGKPPLYSQGIYRMIVRLSDVSKTKVNSLREATKYGIGQDSNSCLVVKTMLPSRVGNGSPTVTRQKSRPSNPVTRPLPSC